MSGAPASGGAAGSRPGLGLRTPGPLELLDRAFALARRGGAPLLGPSLLGGALLSAVAIAGYYLEFVEGVRGLRLPLAAALVVAWWLRAALAGRAARHAVRALAPELEAEEGAGHPLDALRTAAVVGTGLWVWLWVPAAASLLGPLGVALSLPLLALRGAVAPSWLAHVGMRRGGGLSTFLDAARDAGGRRVAGVLVEGMVLLGTLGLFVNLYALAVALLFLLRTYLGLPLALLEGFLSLRNTFVWVVAGAATLTLAEPLRAALAAVAYVDARARHEGLDLRAAIEEAIARTARRAGGPALALALASAALAGALGAPIAHAQVPPPPGVADEASQAGPLEAGPLVAGPLEDQAVRAEVARILARDEFREFDDSRGRGLRALIRHLFDWLLERLNSSPELSPFDLPAIPLPGAIFFLVIGGLLLVGVGVFVFLSHRRRPTKGARPGAADEVVDPLSRAPAEHLGEAAALAARGRYREALRALYLATLGALDRRGRIAFDPSKTNWQYLRRMPRGPERRRFGELTRIFDRSHYGLAAVSPEEYARCAELAEALVGEGPERGARQGGAREAAA